jgi:hypothetical protein
MNQDDYYSRKSHQGYGSICLLICAAIVAVAVAANSIDHHRPRPQVAPEKVATC